MNDNRITTFIRSVILNNKVPFDVRDEALSLYEEAIVATANKGYTIGGITVGKKTYDSICAMSPQRGYVVAPIKELIGLLEAKNAIYKEFNLD